MPWIDDYEFDDDFQDFRIDDGTASFWADRITMEVGPGHPLNEGSWTVVAKYLPQDEVVVRRGADVALVHLTFTQSPPDRLPWPATTFFESMETFDAHFKYR